MDATPPPSAVVRQKREHGSLREQAARLKESASAKAASDEGAFDRLQRDVTTFTGALYQHFDAEERGGAFDEIVQRRPDLVGRTRRLTSDHGELRAGFEALRADFARAPSGELASRLLGLIHRFEAHEADENQLLLSAWGDDLGVGD